MPVSRYCQSPHATESTVGDRVVLYHRVSQTAIVLNPTGTWMWRHMKTPRAAEDLARELRARFDAVDEAQAAQDVAAFLDDLSKHALISVT
jgi:hypothetical protein